MEKCSNDLMYYIWIKIHSNFSLLCIFFERIEQILLYQSDATKNSSDSEFPILNVFKPLDSIYSVNFNKSKKTREPKPFNPK